MPTTIRGYTIRKNDEYTIVLNSKLNVEQQREAYLHEVMHIESNDYESDLAADLIEIFAHKR